MSIIVFQHSDLGRPGRLGLTLRDHGHRLNVVRPDLGDPIPPDFDDVDGVIALGGPQSVAVGAPRPAWMTEELAFLTQAHERQLPLIGVCLGHQMLAVALGGEVAAMPRPEVGFHAVSANVPGQIEPVLAGIPWTLHHYCHHNDAVSKPAPGAVTLSSSKTCPVQAFRAGLRTYAFQYHFEADRDMVIAFARSSGDELERAGVSESLIARQLDEHNDRFARAADRLCLNLMTFLFAPVGMRDAARAVREG